jgi:hypothetical protein
MLETGEALARARRSNPAGQMEQPPLREMVVMAGEQAGGRRNFVE